MFLPGGPRLWCSERSKGTECFYLEALGCGVPSAARALSVSTWRPSAVVFRAQQEHWVFLPGGPRLWCSERSKSTGCFYLEALGCGVPSAARALSVSTWRSWAVVFRAQQGH